MERHFLEKRIVLIDLHRYWRETLAHALYSAGFNVCTLDSYHYFLRRECLGDEEPDLVVLSCVRVRREEEQVIAQILSCKHHLLVLGVSLPWQVMRSLFLLGVDDIVEKPSESAAVIHLVNDVLEGTVAAIK